MSDRDWLRGTGECLNPEQLEAFVEGRSPDAQTHVDSCPECAHEVASLREFLSEEIRPEEAQDVEWMLDRLKPAAAARVRLPWFSWRGLPLVPRWAFSLAAVLFVVAGGLQLRRIAGPSLHEDGVESVVRSGQVTLTSPQGDVDEAPDAFQWQAVAQAASYEVVLTEVDGAPLWSSRTNQLNLSVPDAIQAQMLPRKTLLWRVRAIDAAGAVIAESSSERFRVVAPSNR